MRSTAGKNHWPIADKVGFAPTESRDNTPPAATRYINCLRGREFYATARDNDRLAVPLARLITEARVAIQKALDD